MKRLSLAAVFVILWTSAVCAQSSPGFIYGQVPTAAQWNNAFSKKQDTLGYVPLNRAGDSMLGRLSLFPPSAPGSGLNVGVGVAPSMPNNGDVWMTVAGLYYQAGGVIYGPLIQSPLSSVTILPAGGLTKTGNCAITSSGTCTLYTPGGWLNLLRNNSLAAWFHGCVAAACTITTAGGWCAEGVWVIPTGASVTCQQTTVGPTGTPNYNAMKITGAASVTDVVVRFVIDSLVSARLASQLTTFQMLWINNTGGSVTPTIQTKYATTTPNGGQTNNGAWAGATTDLSAVGMQACANASSCNASYTFAASASTPNGYEINVDLGNNFSTSGKTATIGVFDYRVTPGVTSGTNANPPPAEVRDSASDVSWNQRFYESTYTNGVLPGTVTVVGEVYVVNNGLTNSAGTVATMPVSYSTRKRCPGGAVTAYSPATGTSGKVRSINDAADVTPTLQAQGEASMFWTGPQTTTTTAVGMTGQFTTDCTITGG